MVLILSGPEEVVDGGWPEFCWLIQFGRSACTQRNKEPCVCGKTFNDPRIRWKSWQTCTILCPDSSPVEAWTCVSDSKQSPASAPYRLTGSRAPSSWRDNRDLRHVLIFWRWKWWMNFSHVSEDESSWSVCFKSKPGVKLKGDIIYSVRFRWERLECHMTCWLWKPMKCQLCW